MRSPTLNEFTSTTALSAVMARLSNVIGIAALFCALLASLAAPAFAAPSFINFESGQVRPLAITPDGTKLIAVNTPDNRIEVFDISAGGLIHSSVVKVGMEPVSVVARSNTEIWVVNHLSDSISIVSLVGTPKVTRTLLVGDEPRDIVFAGTGNNRAFITTAHRGQHRTHSSISAVTGAGDPEFTTPSVSRADVWVFDATSLGTTLGGTPVEIVELFGDTPRALAVTPDGNTVYAAVFHSGNQTTVVSDQAVCDGFATAGTCVIDGQTMPGGNPGPSVNHQLDTAPEVGLIIRYDNAQSKWVDELNRDWSNYVQFNLPDQDVFSIDANTLTTSVKAANVGTILFNMVVHPTNGRLYVSNTEAPNEVRFEGAGSTTSTVQGHVSETRITVIDGTTPTPRHLNKHINYAVTPAPAGTKDHSLATPTGMAVSGDGLTMYVAAFGSSRVGVVPIANLDTNWAGFDPTTASANYISVTGGGPSGLVLDEQVSWQRMYVLTRFDNSVSVVDLNTGLETDHLSMHTPEGPDILNGRAFLYDAQMTSSNGEASCASCHIFGDNDNLAWDLGDPDANVSNNLIPINLSVALVASGQVPPDINGSGDLQHFHPMKGPMTTQTLRGMQNGGSLHWRGDRSQPGNFLFDEFENFKNFDLAFQGLIGRNAKLNNTQMESFATFALTIQLPPNPVRALDNSLTADQQAGKDFFDGPRRSDGLANDIVGIVTGFTCEGCHTLDPAQGFFGTNGNTSFEQETQIVKVPHLRNLYTKIGMFGLLDLPGIRDINDGHEGDQIRGFGFNHDGTIDSMFRFFSTLVFEEDFAGTGVGFDGPLQGDEKRNQTTEFMLAFDTDLAPMVGQQVTLDATNLATVASRIDAMEAATLSPFTSEILDGLTVECEVIVHGTVGGVPRGWLFSEFDSLYYRDDLNAITSAQMRALPASEGPVTFTCVPPGSRFRMAWDRDSDGTKDLPDNCPSVDNPGQEDFDGDGDGDACDEDDDNDGVLDGDDTNSLNASICEDVDADTCDDCAIASDGLGPLPDNDPANDGADFDGDGACDTGDADDDNDGVADGSDTNSANPNICADVDADTCDDCAISVDGLGPLADNDPANDGTDTDSDGSCNAGDSDDDNDGVADGSDTNSLNPNVCQDVDADTCDDCAIGLDGFGALADNTPANDGIDTDGDGSCNAGDGDDDNDGVADGSDTNSLDPNICQDIDADSCDDCTVGVDGFGALADNTPANDGIDTDSDGACNASDGDDDNDGVADGSDTNSLNPNVCQDTDADSCDDCAVGVDGFGTLADNTPANDGTDTDSDGLCNTGDGDDDNDGVADGSDTDLANPSVCEDSDGDSCDDCAVGTDGLGPLSDNDPTNDGLDTDGDGACNVGDTDDDNDNLLDGVETDTGTFLSASDTGTDPLLFDTDGDGYSDGDEVLAGYDPTNPFDPGESPSVPVLAPLGQLILGLGLAATALRRAR
ncbi:MAG: DNA-binding beta-propeller fold protein YncE, partial [Myxococcota bacterium]